MKPQKNTAIDALGPTSDSSVTTGGAMVSASIPGDSVFTQLREWMHGNLPWWAMSFSVHKIAIASLLLLGKMALPSAPHSAVEFADAELPPPESKQLIPDVTVADPERADPIDSLAVQPSIQSTSVASPPDVAVGMPNAPLENSMRISRGEKFNGDASGPGPGGTDLTCRIVHENVASRPPYGPRDTFSHKHEYAISAALNWFSHHQSRDGSWSLQQFPVLCKDKSCSGVASQESKCGATGLALLPFLAAGQTQYVKGLYKVHIEQGIYWLLAHQKPDGDLSAGADQQMYSHAIATIALCEDFGMTREKNGRVDRPVGIAAQKAVNFIIAAQNTSTGGWRYRPGDEGDTSVVGWQVMALRSADIAGLSVPPDAFAGAKRWLRSVSKAAPGGSSGAGMGQFSYQPDGAATPAMSSVGLLCAQYLKAGKQDPQVVGGVRYLMANLPDPSAENVYYWYYASQLVDNPDIYEKSPLIFIGRLGGATPVRLFTT